MTRARVSHLNRELRDTPRGLEYARLHDFADLRAAHYFYEVPDSAAELRADLDRFTALAAERGIDPREKVLIANLRRVPDLQLARSLIGRFGEQHLFLELWGDSDLRLLEAGFSNVSYLPVTSPTWADARSARREAPPPFPVERGRPRRDGVFVSLGRSDDHPLIAAVIAANRDTRFVVPRFGKSSDGQLTRAHPLRGPNVELFDNRAEGEYLRRYLSCDTVLILTEPQTGMKGGLRVADALAFGKYFVVSSSRATQMAMAFPERTCLVVDSEEATSRALRRILAGELRVDLDVYHALRRLTDAAGKLEAMLGAAAGAALPADSLLRAGSFASLPEERSPGTQLSFLDAELRALLGEASRWRLSSAVLGPRGRRVRLSLERDGDRLDLTLAQATDARSFHAASGVALSYRAPRQPPSEEAVRELRRLAPGIIAVVKPVLDDPAKARLAGSPLR